MAIQTATQRATLAVAYGVAATHAALYTTVPGAAQGTEVAGGSPAYARKANSWSGVNPNVSTPAAFDVPSGTTVVGAGVHSSSVVNTAYLDGAAVTSQGFSSQGQYTITITYTQT